MVKPGAVLLLILLSNNALAADGDAIAKRKAIFKKIGEATKPVVAMLKHQQPYDPQVVEAALATYRAGSKSLPSLFPPDSKTGGETEARPVIWDEKPQFEALFAKLDATTSGATTTIADETSFRATMPKVLGVCKGCHDVYREKK